MLDKKLNKLVIQLRNGKKEKFGEFYDLTKTSVYYIIHKIIKDRQQIEDVMQEAYINFINSLYKLDESRNVFSYLLTISHNLAVNTVRKHAQEESIDFIENVEEEKKDTIFELDNPLFTYCKSHLTEEEYKILELTVVMGYRRVEVAKIINQPVSTVNWKYNQILKKIKTYYKEVYGENKEKDIQ